MQHQPRSVLADGSDRRAVSWPAEMLRAHVCYNSDLPFLTEANDVLSDGMTKRAGFKGLRASGLLTGCSLGYHDASEASCSQLVDVVERMMESTELPVLVDAHSGFANLNKCARTRSTWC
ncbi:isocitrate lyase/phosphoenolpyruvate mutase family protein [Bradyrhizobium sp. i1.15.2]|uniref:isocitrate lyase/phosphoenolpyruvate mutase family protein n=1 Tax=Bradyrhizobium sp. i1.15.2 TaxID=3156362 RepID=UPI003398237F